MSEKEKPKPAKSLRDNLRTSMQQKAYKQLIDVGFDPTRALIRTPLSVLTLIERTGDCEGQKQRGNWSG